MVAIRKLDQGVGNTGDGMASDKPFRIAVGTIQAAPIFLDKEAMAEKESFCEVSR